MTEVRIQGQQIQQQQQQGFDDLTVNNVEFKSQGSFHNANNNNNNSNGGSADLKVNIHYNKN